MNIEADFKSGFHRLHSKAGFSSLEERLRFDVEQTLKSLYADLALADHLDDLYIPLATWIADRTKPGQHPLVVGMGGAQGCGKTTLCSVLSRVLTKGFALKTIVLSIDDLYKTQDQRQAMAKKVHPLFVTRGVPGTHDMELAEAIFMRLHDLKSGEVMRLPSFDKSIDERRSVRVWNEVEGPIDIILFEGWCVGMQPQENSLTEPLNALERELDPDLVWRTAVNEALLNDYKLLFAKINLMMWMQAPNYEVVYDWRNKQERLLEAHLFDIHGEGLDKIDLTVMSPDELRNFMQFYERLTKHMLLTMPDQVDVLLKLNSLQQVVEVKFPAHH